MSIAEIAVRFQGVSIECRRDWSPPWRAKLVANKNERDDYRITVYGGTMEEAIVALVAAVEVADGKPH